MIPTEENNKKIPMVLSDILVDMNKTGNRCQFICAKIGI